MKSWNSSQSSSRSSSPDPAPAPALAPPTIPAPEPEPIHLDEVHCKLGMMKFELPSFHHKRLFVCRSFNGCNLSTINPHFDLAAFASSAENTFVKTCCGKYTSVHECRCFEWRSKSSVTFINEEGESIEMYFLTRKTDYKNLTLAYPKSYHPDEAIPDSPDEDVSDSDRYPWSKDYDFENECGDAYTAERLDLTHVWSNEHAKQGYERRYERRQHRLQQLASGELPKYGLLILTFDTDKLSPVTTQAHDHRRQQHREKYMQIYESCVEKHQCRPEPVIPSPISIITQPSSDRVPEPHFYKTLLEIMFIENKLEEKGIEYD